MTHLMFLKAVVSVKDELHHCDIDDLWGQPIKLAQVASTSELIENQRNDLLFFEIVPCHSAGPQKYKHKIGHN